MDYWINKENLRIIKGKENELSIFLQKTLRMVDYDLETLMCRFLGLDEVYFEDDHIRLVGKGIYDEEHWKDLAPFLEGFVEWSSADGLFRDVFEGGRVHSISPTVQWENEPILVPHLKKYFAYLDDDRNVFKVPVPAINEKAVIEYVNGNGEIIAIKDATKDYPISLEKVRDALAKQEFGEAEIALILRALEFTEIAR